MDNGLIQNSRKKTKTKLTEVEISHLPERVQGNCHEYAQWTTQENREQTESFNRKYKEEPNRAEEYNNYNWNKNILEGTTVD